MGMGYGVCFFQKHWSIVGQ
jgi:hypothetical protein